MIAQKEIPTCSHLQRISHDEYKCWKLHAKHKPKNFVKEKDEKKEIAAFQQELGSYLGDERRITAIILTDKTSNPSSMSNTIAS